MSQYWRDFQGTGRQARAGLQEGALPLLNERIPHTTDISTWKCTTPTKKPRQLPKVLLLHLPYCDITLFIIVS
jgi:hypothetical protein